jgi:hypothetical protein
MLFKPVISRLILKNLVLHGDINNRLANLLNIGFRFHFVIINEQNQPRQVEKTELRR